MKNLKPYIGMGFVGAILGSLVTLVFLGGADDSVLSDAANTEQEPLYWVAPMDPNYRRDKPGKSPMGMDLIPFYENSAGENDAGPGTILINPDVINNLGVRTVKAKFAPLNSTIKTVGYVQYDEDQLAHIHPRVEGWVEKLYVTASGDPVKKDQALYTLYSPQLVNAQEELVLALNRKNARLIQASEDRLKALHMPQRFINELKKSRSVKQNVTFYAPKSGVVDNLNVREGFYVKPGTTLMSIGTLDEVWVEAEIFERQSAQVKVGLPVTMTLDYLPGKKWQGEVGYVYPALDEKTRTARIRLRFNNDDFYLKPNMFAQVVIHSNNQEKTLIVPRESVIRTGSQNRVVLALGGGAFKSVEVTLGQLTEEFVEILSGISDGENIVSSAQFLLDSESSKTSDFKRINHGVDHVDKVKVRAEILEIMPAMRMVRLTHEPISEWDWPVMTMSLIAEESVDLAVLTVGDDVNIEITKDEESGYILSEARSISIATEAGIHLREEHVGKEKHGGSHIHESVTRKRTNDSSTQDHSDHGAH